MEQKAIEAAKKLREHLGGTVFAFPIDPYNEFSEYAVVVYESEQYFVYPETEDISTAALCITVLLDEFKRIGKPKDFDKEVRLVTFKKQMDAPSVVMRRLKRGY